MEKPIDAVRHDVEINDETEEKKMNTQFLDKIKEEMRISHQEQLHLYSTACNDWHRKCEQAEQQVALLDDRLSEARVRQICIFE